MLSAKCYLQIVSNLLLWVPSPRFVGEGKEGGNVY